jgi:flagellar motor switch protein FliN
LRTPQELDRTMSATQAAIDALFASGAEASDADETAPARESTGTPARARRAHLDRILHISVPVSVTLAERDMPVEIILSLHAGSIIEFEKPFDSELSLRVGNREIGIGQTVKVGENFGLRITSVNTVIERIDAMGGR